MLSLALLITAQTTDFGVRELGQPPAQQGRRVGTINQKAEQGSAFSCSVVSITDGDTLRCADGTRIRIAGIDAPLVSACRAGRKCVDGDAAALKRSLAAVASGQTLSCRPVGTSYNRVVAFCSEGGVDLSVRKREPEAQFADTRAAVDCLAGTKFRFHPLQT